MEPVEPLPVRPVMTSLAPGEARVARLPAAPDAAHRARRWLDEAVPELPGEVRGTLRLLVTEVVTNAVRHAGLLHDDHVELRVRRDGARLRVEVADPGGAMGDVQIRPSRQDGGGFGLLLVDRLAERWGHHSSDAATRVWFELAVPYGSARQ